MPPAGKEDIHDPRRVELRTVDAAAPSVPSGRPGHARRLNEHKPQHICATPLDCVITGVSLTAVAQAPRTRYAKCGDIDIAYQVFGDGPVDLLVLPGPFIPFDSIDAEPSMYRFHRRLASFARVIRFDHRGMGLSSRCLAGRRSGRNSGREDALAVMDAVGCEQATVFGSGFTAMTGARARRRPSRAGAQPGDRQRRRARCCGRPTIRSGAQIGRTEPFTTVAIEPDAVEQGFDVLSIIAPTVADDDAFRTLVGSRGQPRGVAEYGPRDHRSARRRPTCATRSRASPRRR